MSKKLIQAAAGAAGAGESIYVEDVFSTYIYDGASASKTITNDIDLSGEGGLIWTKRRDGTARTHILVDTERGAGNVLNTDGTYAEYTISNMPSSFNSDGYTITSTDAGVNDSSYNYVSWSFRKQAGFFDVVTYTGDGTEGQTINHNLGSTPGFIAIKRTDAATSWTCHHTSLGTTKVLTLNSTSAATNETRITNVGSTSFDVSSSSKVGGTGGTYVAYVFAHDDQSFGDDSDESIIQCGSYLGSDGADVDVNLGFEPQWLMIKNTERADNWTIIDSMRGLTARRVVSSYTDKHLEANTSDAEETGTSITEVILTATGFIIPSGASSEVGEASEAYIYIAIRRPMKTPESGTEVFNVIARSGTGSSPTVVDNGFTADMVLYREREEGYDPFGFRIQDRFRGQNFIETFSTDAEANFISDNPFNDKQNSIVWNTSGYHVNDVQGTYVFNSFKRATGFFDVVAYSGTGSVRTINHNLGVEPEMVIFKKRSGFDSWPVYLQSVGNTGLAFYLNESYSSPVNTNVVWFNNTSPTSSQITLGSGGAVNESGGTFIAYLFGSVAGVSKVGSYTGTGSNVNVDCGFSAGARFILIKRSDSSGDWYVYDSVRGIVAGNDPYLLLNTTAAEVTSTDYIDPLSSGFTVTSSAPAALNASGGSYIFLAIS